MNKYSHDGLVKLDNKIEMPLGCSISEGWISLANDMGKIKCLLLFIFQNDRSIITC
jgi:hypothetical protein